MSGFRGRSATARPAKQKTPTRTPQVTSLDASASTVIPAVTELQRLLLKETDEDLKIKTMKHTSCLNLFGMLRIDILYQFKLEISSL